MKNNIPWYALVRDIQIHPETHDLVLATHGRGIMIVDDISTIRSLNKEILARDVHFFDVKPMTLTTGSFGSGGTSSQGSWGTGNAPSIPPFTYYLRDRVSSGEVKVEIYDEAGKLVQSVQGTNRKGINRIFWNQRTKTPKTAQGTKPDYGAFVSPQVLPGNYTAKLKVGSKEYSQPLVMLHDADNTTFSLADRQLQYKTAMELYDLHGQLAKLVSDIQDRQKILKDSIPKVSQARAKKKLQESYDKLETLRAELVPTKPNSAFADEKRLRDDISEVYRAVCGNEAAPGNLQIEQVGVLKQRVADAEKRFRAIQP